jgi:hypothetical protein
MLHMIRGKRINYVIATWSGKRRIEDTRSNCLGVYYLKSHLTSLFSLRNHLDQITIMVPDNPEEPQDFTNHLGWFPKSIKSTNVVIQRRPNRGFSYGSLLDCYATYRDQFDYYFLMEDDYFYCLHDFDQIAVDMFESYPNCGFLCGQAISYMGLRYHAAIAYGLVSSKALAVVEPGLQRYLSADNYTEAESLQYSFGISFIDNGFGVYDFTPKYRVAFRHKDFHISHYPEDSELPVLVQPI